MLFKELYVIGGLQLVELLCNRMQVPMRKSVMGPPTAHLLWQKWLQDAICSLHFELSFRETNAANIHQFKKTM